MENQDSTKKCGNKNVKNVDGSIAETRAPKKKQ